MITKRILSASLMVIMVALICLPAFATSPVENTVQYMSKNLYKADVEYIKEYRVKYEKVKKISGENKKVVVTVKNTVLKPFNDLPYQLTKLEAIPKCKIQLTTNNGTILAVKKPTLKIGKHTYQIVYKVKKKGTPISKYAVTISVFETDTDEIDETVEKKWEKVERPSNKKWKTQIYSGEYPNPKQDLISAVGGINKHTTSADIYGRAKIILKNTNPQSPNKWYSVKEKLNVGDNTLEKIIKYDPRPKAELECKPCWYKWEFVLNLSKDEEPTTEPTPTPSDNPTPTPSDDPTTSDDPTPSATPIPSDDDPTPAATPTPANTNYYSSTDTLPKTGESDPITFTIAGLIIICTGLGFYKFRHKLIKN